MLTVMTLPALVAQLVAEVASMAVYDGAKIELFTNTTPIQPNNVYADLILPTYGGYARSSAVVYGTPHVRRDGSVQCLTASKSFAPTDSTATSTVTGMALVNTGGTLMFASMMFDNPVIMATPDDVVVVLFALVKNQPTSEAQDALP